jgi:hypothetical protein
VHLEGNGCGLPCDIFSAFAWQSLRKLHEILWAEKEVTAMREMRMTVMMMLMMNNDDEDDEESGEGAGRVSVL